MEIINEEFPSYGVTTGAPFGWFSEDPIDFLEFTLWFPEGIWRFSRFDDKAEPHELVLAIRSLHSDDEWKLLMGERITAARSTQFCKHYQFSLPRGRCRLRITKAPTEDEGVHDLTVVRMIRGSLKSRDEGFPGLDAPPPSAGPTSEPEDPQAPLDGAVLASLRRLSESGALDEHFRRCPR